ncbi:hypothetical protein GPJ56_008247 [Histomonas meleagridis]|uniref:uncharacterized protein n=1 Tax=Histomonas meleagridis TaxID=135588 RepID=UPI003559B0E0|nr:hypothetical protein GPJ56_008247 [Histomonas meleagridis]KAH0797269.1 hypothetical protein GO595_009951 [Histomonas meleagridis]
MNRKDNSNNNYKKEYQDNQFPDFDSSRGRGSYDEGLINEYDKFKQNRRQRSTSPRVGNIPKSHSVGHMPSKRNPFYYEPAKDDRSQTSMPSPIQPKHDPTPEFEFKPELLEDHTDNQSNKQTQSTTPKSLPSERSQQMNTSSQSGQRGRNNQYNQMNRNRQGQKSQHEQPSHSPSHQQAEPPKENSNSEKQTPNKPFNAFNMSPQKGSQSNMRNHDNYHKGYRGGNKKNFYDYKSNSKGTP